MSSFQQVTLLGNVGKDPEVKYSANGNAIANLSIATSRKWKDKNDERHEETEWHRITFFGRQAEIVGEYVRKGNPLFVTGYLKTRKWQDKDGADRYTTEIIAETFQLLARNEGGSEPAERPAARQASKPAPKQQSIPGEDDDIPF
jgi:single-strand DNA-binding protein